MADWISLREYSRRRNVTLGAVQKAIASGRVTAVRRDDKGRLVAIDAELATQQWSTNTDPDLALRTGTVVPPPPDRIPTREDAQRVSEDASGGLVPSDAESALPQAQQAGKEPEASPSGGDSEFHRHRTERARLDVEKQRADLAERMGALASVDAMRAAAGESARLVNTKLMELPERLSPLLAVETDPLRIHALLTSEIRGVLNALADRARELGA
jgi:hypothetical protein